MADNPSVNADWKLDEGLEETFPASDAPANTVETGIRPVLPPLAQDVAGQQREHGDGEES